MKRSTRAVMTIGVALGLAGSATADLLYGIDLADESIFRLDTTNGDLEKFFGHPVSSFGGLDFDSRGNLYLQQFGSLYRIDLGNPANDVEIGKSNRHSFESFEIVGDTGYAADVFDRFLYTIDLSSNAATALPISPRDSPITGLASSDGTNPRMYGALILDDEIIEIDPTTGDSLGVRVSGLPGSVTSLAYGSDDNLWFIPALRTTLYSADPETGTITATLMGLDVGHVSGLTAVLPGPGAIGLFGLAGLAGRRRRRV